jgi:hypothetical protein
MADNVLYSQSLESQEVSVPFINRSVQYITDLNNNSYGSGQILIDSSSLSNSGRWCAYNESYLEVPLVAALYPAASQTPWQNRTDFNFSTALKNGGVTLIHSLSCELNNSNVIQLTPYTSFYLNYKLLTTLSQDDLTRMGHSICFWPDTSDSWTYSSDTDGSVDGKGSCNNRVFGCDTLYPSNAGRIFSANAIGAGDSPITISAIAAGEPIDCLYTTNYPHVEGTLATNANQGFYQRAKMWAYPVDNAKYTTFLLASDAKQLFKNYYSSEASKNNTYGAKVWYMLVHIKLRHVSDLFQQLPLSRGLYFRWILNLNVGTATLTATGVAGTTGVTGAGGYDTTLFGTPAVNTWKLASAPTLTNSVFPLIFASAAPGQPNFFLGAGTWYLGCGIQKYTLVTSTADTFSHQQGTVRMYVPCYTMSAAAEAAYLEMNGPAKTIIYEDILSYQITNIAAGSTCNQLITNGVVSPTKIVIVPFLTATANDGVVPPFQSPFASEPGTTSPLASLSGFQCLLSGQTIFMLNEDYEYTNFIDEFSRSGLNGGITDGLSSGLVSEYSWSQNHRYYVIDVERRTSDAESVVPKSIQLLFTNKSNKAYDYYVYVVVRRSFSINLASGALVA